MTIGPADTYSTNRRLNQWGTAGLGFYFFLLACFLMTLLVNLWPIIEKVQKGESSSQDFAILWNLVTFSLSPDSSYLMLVIVVSAIGGYIHSATSFVTYVGNRNLASSWVWWYLLRLFIGIALALLLYFAIRGGFLAQGTLTEQISPYGVAALAGLTGLFSKQATDKLRELFDILFRTSPGSGDEERRDKLTNASTPTGRSE